MARIKIKDLPKEMKIRPQDLRLIRGGNVLTTKSDGRVSAFPDVCLTPNSDISTPIPYPDIATKSSGATKETKQPVIQAYVIVPDIIFND